MGFSGREPIDERIEELNIQFQSGVQVKAIEADNVGGVKIFFTEHYLLEVIPDSSAEGEHWRFFSFHEDASFSHFVVTGKGIEN